MIKYLWDEKTAFFYDRYFNGTMMPVKTIAGFYPLLASHMPQKYVDGMVAMFRQKDFATAVPVPTVSIFTDDFSSDLDRGDCQDSPIYYISSRVSPLIASPAQS